MTIGGWLVMTFSVGGVTTLLVWCITRVMRQATAASKLHSQSNIDTRDQDT